MPIVLVGVGKQSHGEVVNMLFNLAITHVYMYGVFWCAWVTYATTSRGNLVHTCAWHLVCMIGQFFLLSLEVLVNVRYAQFSKVFCFLALFGLLLSFVLLSSRRLV